jgi:hypothetical protein
VGILKVSVAPDLVVIDTPGIDSPAANAAMRVADLCLIPCRPTATDLRGCLPTVQSMMRLGKPFAFVLGGFEAALREIGCPISQIPRRGARAGDECASSRLGALQPIMRAEQPAAIARHQARGVGRPRPRVEAVRTAGWDVDADVAGGDDLGQGERWCEPNVDAASPHEVTERSAKMAVSSRARSLVDRSL